jgi:hypothetical protein
MKSSYSEFRQYVERRLLPSGGFSNLSYVLQRSETFEVPVTVKRIRPLDLFPATQRVTASRYVNNEVTQWTRGGYQYQGPISYLASSGETSKFPLPAADWSKIDGRLRAKIKASNLNLAQSLAEYRQTSSMVAGLASDIVKTFRSLRSGRAFGEFVRALQQPRSRSELAVANRWLQYQYGLKPLMSDIYGSAEALATKIRDGFPMYVRSSDEDKAEGTEILLDRDSLPYSASYERTRKMKAVARYVIRDAALKQLSQIGISNPALLAWELFPYSFVIDWVFPVGNFLSSIDSLNGTSNLVVNRSTRETYKMTSVIVGAKSVYFSDSRNRAVATTNLAMPSLSYQPSSSLSAVANGLALLRQLRR